MNEPNDLFGNKIYGKQVLKEVKDKLEPLKKEIECKELKLVIIQFRPSKEHVTEESKSPFLSAEKSTQAKIKTFREIGIEPISLKLDWDFSEKNFKRMLTKLGKENDIAGIIVQYPMDEKHKGCLSLIPEEKDIDFLRGQNSLFKTPATSEAIVRIVEPFTKDKPIVAVVGSKGFVGSGVTELLKNKGLQILELDRGDNLLRIKEADIVIATTNIPNLLNQNHLVPHHRLVVDCGFSPMGSEIYGNVDKSAYHLVQNITPVPGGTGPLEMAVLAERVVGKELNVEIPPWKLEKVSYLNRDEINQVKISPNQNLTYWSNSVDGTLINRVSLTDTFGESLEDKITKALNNREVKDLAINGSINIKLSSGNLDLYSKIEGRSRRELRLETEFSKQYPDVTVNIKYVGEQTFELSLKNESKARLIAAELSDKFSYKDNLGFYQKQEEVVKRDFQKLPHDKPISFADYRMNYLKKISQAAKLYVQEFDERNPKLEKSFKTQGINRVLLHEAIEKLNEKGKPFLDELKQVTEKYSIIQKENSIEKYPVADLALKDLPKKELSSDKERINKNRQDRDR